MLSYARLALVLGLGSTLAACSESSNARDDPAGDAAADAPTDAPNDVVTSDALCTAGPERNGPYSQLVIAGNPGAKGAFDPSVVYAEGAELGLMTYTTVPDEAHVHIAIATSTDAGASWQYSADVTQAAPITIATSDEEVCGSASCAGFWVHESSSLVLDPTDPDESRRLKVFAHSYFFSASGRRLELGYIAMYSAPTPSGPWSETKLFGWQSSSSISSDGVAYDVSEDPALAELHDCYIVGEPGGLFREPSTLELTLSCVKSTGSIDVRLLRSSDHGATWSVVSTLLTQEDGLALGSTTPRANGSALLRVGDRHYVIMSPDGLVDFPDGPGSGYRGCVVVPIADLDTGTIERCEGKPVVAAAYLGEPGQFVGACSADVGATNNGMLIPLPDFSNPASVGYRIFSAGLPLP